MAEKKDLVGDSSRRRAMFSIFPQRTQKITDWLADDAVPCEMVSVNASTG
jgi:hypothetical protein